MAAPSPGEREPSLGGRWSWVTLASGHGSHRPPNQLSFTSSFLLCHQGREEVTCAPMSSPLPVSCFPNKPDFCLFFRLTQRPL